MSITKSSKLTFGSTSRIRRAASLISSSIIPVCTTWLARVLLVVSAENSCFHNLRAASKSPVSIQSCVPSRRSFASAGSLATSRTRSGGFLTWVANSATRASRRVISDREIVAILFTPFLLSYQEKPEKLATAANAMMLFHRKYGKGTAISPKPQAGKRENLVLCRHHCCTSLTLPHAILTPPGSPLTPHLQVIRRFLPSRHLFSERKRASQFARPANRQREQRQASFPEVCGFSSESSYQVTSILYLWNSMSYLFADTRRTIAVESRKAECLQQRLH